MSTIKRLLKRIKYYIQRNNSYPKTIVTEAFKMALLLLIVAIFVGTILGVFYTFALIIQIILAAIIGKQIPLYICGLILIFIYWFTNLIKNKIWVVIPKLTTRQNWEQVKVEIMLRGLTQKWTKEPFRSQLLHTTELVEWNNWNDSIWGVPINTNEGQNILGNLLMLIRDNL